MQYNETCAKNQQDCNTCYARTLTLCSALNDSELAELNSFLTHVKVSAGETLFLENDDAQFIYTLTGGHAKMQKSLSDGRTQIIGFATPGDILANVHQQHYSYTVEAITNCTLCKFPRTSYRNFIEAHPIMERVLFKKLAQELRDNQELMLLLGRKTAVEKLATFILYLSDKAARVGLGTTHIHLPMTRSEIADYLGLTTESVSRAVTKLKQSETVNIPHPKRIEITDRDALTKLKDNDGANA